MRAAIAASVPLVVSLALITVGYFQKTRTLRLESSMGVKP